MMNDFLPFCVYNILGNSLAKAVILSLSKGSRPGRAFRSYLCFPDSSFVRTEKQKDTRFYPYCIFRFPL